MRVAIGCDHAAVAMKDGIVKSLREAGLTVQDEGTFSGDAVDYPDFAARVASLVASGKADRGIVLCGTGIGVCIAANKIPGIRAAVCHDVTTARLARRHNDANVLCMGARTTGASTAADAVAAFLETEFEGGRHVQRVRKIEALEGRHQSAGKETRR
ncbi:MAG TPA: ribose 5-phosphate isomerase B [Candidatus Polarisedimenticolia bacterium]|nr:ribose 5-phosphate isomerase B [Candidatus Polarisedimenticolia bacterium]